MSAVALPSAPVGRNPLRHEPLFATAAGVLALAIVPLALGVVLDPRTLGGEPVWLKPLKFALSLSVYLGTLAWFARWLPAGMTGRRWYRIYAAAVVFCIGAEMVWIGGAAAARIRSHYNLDTALMRDLYSLMGVFAVVLTSATAVYGVAIWRNSATGLAPAVRLSLALGLLATFGLTLLAAGAMASQPGHGVGEAVTGARVPLFGWSLEGGDLRPAHFAATHGLHVLPLAGLALAGLVPDRWARAGVVGATVLYAALVLGLLGQGFAGRAIWDM